MSAQITKKPKLDEVQKFIDATNAEYERVHLAFEREFWGANQCMH